MIHAKKQQIVEGSTLGFLPEKKKLAMWVLNHGLLQSGSCHLVSEDVASTGSLDPDPDATSYRSHFLLEFIGWLLLVLVKVLVFF